MSVMALKIINDLQKAIKNDPTINKFEIVPSLASEHTNTSPVLRGENTLGFEAWAIRDVMPFAHKKVLEINIKRPIDVSIVGPCLLTLHLLHPKMKTAWNKRRELVSLKKISTDDDLRITQMALSQAPNCNEIFSYRRWLIANNFVKGEGSRIFEEELNVTEMMADKYHSNYHAWSHRKWCVDYFAPSKVPHYLKSGNSSPLLSVLDMCYLYETTNLSLYVKELESLSLFYFSHVSDHSSISYRVFIIEKMLKIFGNAITIDIDNRYTYNRQVCPSNVYHQIRETMKNLLPFPENYNELYKHKKIDLKIGFILLEVQRTSKLLMLFKYHEVLWYYRRFLFLNLYTLLLSTPSEMSTDTKPMYDRIILKEVEREWAFISNYDDNRARENFRYWFKQVLVSKIEKYLQNT